MKGWVKGGIIAVLIELGFFLVGVTAYTLFGVLTKSSVEISAILKIPFTILVWLILIAFIPSGILTELKINILNDITGIIFSIFVYFIFGALIGYIYGIINKKRGKK